VTSTASPSGALAAAGRARALARVGATGQARAAIDHAHRMFEFFEPGPPSSRRSKETRLYPAMVVREPRDNEPDRATDPLALIADWDDPAPDTRQHRWVPKPTRPRPELVATRWGGRGVKEHLFRDDPPA
jgi:hypothetical protein